MMPLAPAAPEKLPALRQNLQLLESASHSDGSPSWRIQDPLRNRFFDIGWLEYELLLRWHPELTADELLTAVASETLLAPSAEELQALLLFLRQHQLLAVSSLSDSASLRQRWNAKKQSWLTLLLHHYLFFRLPLLQPDRTLSVLSQRSGWLFAPITRHVTIGAGLIGIFLASHQSEALERNFSYFFNWEGLLWYGVAATFAKMLHELGHALAAKRYGLRVPTIGVAFLVMWPVLYTDTSESWKLRDRQQRLTVAGAGIASELMLAAWTTLAWALLPDGIIRSICFLLATTTWIWTLAINASPFMRFDGYFLLSDLLDLPNLHERSFALALRMIHSAFFGLESEDPEPDLTPALKRGMIVFACMVWLYRLVLFAGIAVAVYHMFVKLLGLFLMAIEIGWFIVKPLWNESKKVWAQRQAWKLQGKTWLLLGSLLLTLLWLVPVSNQVSAPALLRAAHDTQVFPPSPGRISELHVRPGQWVEAGEVLLVIDSPELLNRIEKARYRSDGFAAEVARSSAGASQLERRIVLQEQLAEALADLSGAEQESLRLSVRAEHAGQVRDLPPDLIPGRWVNSKQGLLRIVDPRQSEVAAWFNENQLRSISVGDRITFYPDRPDVAVVSGKISEIDPSTVRLVPHPLLASHHGGAMAAVPLPKGDAVTHEAMFRVRITPDGNNQAPEQVSRGQARVAVNGLALLANAVAHVFSVLVRELN